MSAPPWGYANNNFVVSWSLSAQQIQGVVVNGKLW